MAIKQGRKKNSQSLTIWPVTDEENVMKHYKKIYGSHENVISMPG